MLKYYVCWLLLMSAVTFFLMGWDKHLARCRRRRIPERVLLSWAAAGGALGGVLGGTLGPGQVGVVAQDHVAPLEVVQVAGQAGLAAAGFGGGVQAMAKGAKAVRLALA